MLVVAVILACGSARAKDIVLDDVVITGQEDGARMDRVPWAGQWWSFSNCQLSKGLHIRDNFEWDEGSKKYEAKEPGASDLLSPLRKYDLFVERRYGTDPQAALFELQGGHGFDHHVDPVEAEKYESQGVSYGWWGHCNGWAAAALMVKEPHTPVVVEGIRFEEQDLKGLLAEVFWSVERDWAGGGEEQDAATFHRVLVTTIRNQNRGVVLDFREGDRRESYPIHAYHSTFERIEPPRPDGEEPRRTGAVVVETTIHHRTCGPGEDERADEERFARRTYTYELYTGDSGRVEEGRWTGDSVDRHPDLAWLPTHNPLGPDHRENHRVEYGKVLEILHADHERSEPELVPRRESDERDP